MGYFHLFTLWFVRLIASNSSRLRIGRDLEYVLESAVEADALSAT
jgi:hypothetical protein